MKYSLEDKIIAKSACKEIIDRSGMVNGELNKLSKMIEAQTQSLATFGVEETKGGEAWLKEMESFQKSAIASMQTKQELLQKLCANQPIIN